MTEKLTGRRRYRVARRWFGQSQIILQVEIQWQDTQYDNGFSHNVKGTGWRDATLEDLSVFEWTE